MNRKRTTLGLLSVLLLCASVDTEPARAPRESGAPDGALGRAQLEGELILAERTAVMLERFTEAIERWERGGAAE